MAKLITGERLRNAVESGTFIQGGLEKCVEGAKYDFRMGSRVLKNHLGSLDTRNLSEAERGQLCLEPGEIAFVLSEETLCLPVNVFATLSPKRKLSHDGILVLGGFFIDPLYEGHLLVGLYNFSTSRWPLRPLRKLIAAVFYTLDDDEQTDFVKPEPIADFPDDLVRMMQMYQPVMLQSLLEKISATQKDISDLRKEFRDQEDWKRTFRESLEKHDRQIDKLLSGLEELGKRLDQEMNVRQTGQQSLDHQLSEIGGRVTEIANTRNRRHILWTSVLSAIIGAVVGAILTTVVTIKFLHPYQAPPSIPTPTAVQTDKK